MFCHSVSVWFSASSGDIAPLIAEEVQKAVATALAGQSALLERTDEKGTMYVVPASALAYVEIGEVSIRKVGFGAI